MFWVQKNFWLPWGIGLSLVLTLGRGRLINFLALNKSTHQVLASYFDYNWFKKFVVGGGGGGGGVKSFSCKTQTKVKLG